MLLLLRNAAQGARGACIASARCSRLVFAQQRARCAARALPPRAQPRALRRAAAARSCALTPPARACLAASSQAPGEPEDPLRKAADWLRARTGPEARGTVLGDSRVDVFRSKDLFRCLHAAKPAFLAALAPPGPDSSADEAKRLDNQTAAVGVRATCARRGVASHAIRRALTRRATGARRRRSCWRRATLRAWTAW